MRTFRIFLVFIQYAVVRVVPITFCSNYISIAEIINGEKHNLGPLRNQMKREPKHLLVKFFRSFTTEVIKNIISIRQMVDYTWDWGE